MLSPPLLLLPNWRLVLRPRDSVGRAFPPVVLGRLLLRDCDLLSTLKVCRWPFRLKRTALMSPESSSSLKAVVKLASEETLCAGGSRLTVLLLLFRMAGRWGCGCDLTLLT